MIPWQIEYSEDGLPFVHIELRSVPLWLAESYLVEIGGEMIEKERLVRGDGWEARLTSGKPVRLGSLRIGRHYLDISGKDEATLQQVMSRLGVMLMRGGG